MRYTFLHAADLHLGSPFTGLTLKDPAISARFAEASRDAFSALIDRALAEPIAFAVIAGDVYDGDWRDTSIGLFFTREIARLVRAGIPVAMVRGNHDAESEITRAVPLPENVHVFSARKAETLRLDDLGVAIHGRSFGERAESGNFARDYPDAVPGRLNIGVLHTSCEGNPAHATYAPCTVAELVGRGYDYWALGHVHEHAVLHSDPWVVFAGNLQGRSVRELGPKGAVLVDVEDGRIAAVRRLVVDRARWVSIAVDLAGVDTRMDRDRAITEALAPTLAATEGKMTALRVTLTGATPLTGALAAHPTALRDDVQALASHLHGDVWLETVRNATRPPQQRVAPAAELDPEVLLAGLAEDAELRARAEALLALVRGKLPSGVAAEDLGDLEALLAEARAVAAARLAEAG
jgi:exonuclease SbcD